MTTYEAINPHHKRVVVTDDLWWVGDAWNERTAQWFSSDQPHFAALIRGLRNLSLSGVSEFMPTAEWLADVCMEALHLPLGNAGEKVSPLDVASAVAAHTAKDYNFTGTLISASSLLASLSPIDRSDFNDAITHAVEYRIKYQQATEDGEPMRRFGIGTWKLAPLLAGLSANPGLPAITGPAHHKTEMSLYRWMFSRGLRDAVKQDGAKVMLQLLCRNLGASTEDLDFILECLDKELKRWQVGLKQKGEQDNPTREFYSYGGSLPKQKLDALYKSVGVHPNFVSHPYVDALYGERVGPFHRITRSAGETATWGHEDTGYSQSRKDRILLDSMKGNVLDSRSAQAEQFIMEALLDGSKAGLLRKLSNRLGKSTQPPTNESLPQVHYIGLHAPAMGAVFAHLDKKYGSEGIPMEWIADIL